MTQDSRGWCWKLGLVGFWVIGGAIVSAKRAFAQITPDATLGAESTQVVSPIPGAFLINGGASRGINLFHSFSEFSVPRNGIGYLNNALNIQNIITRVTGESISRIDGIITANGIANLFMLNPNGIIFGQNAQLNIGGSFLASTANSFTFPDGTSFGAKDTQTQPLLSIHVPIGLQYRTNPGNIVNQAAATDNNGRLVGLQVQSGKSIALVGGDVTLSSGGLSAVGGRIEIGGLVTAGTVGLIVDANTLRLNFPLNLTRGSVTLSNDARVGVRGLGGGDIVINANNFTATNGGRLVAGTEGAGNGGDIIVNAGTVNISGRGASVGSGLLNDALPGSSGNLGNIIINAKSVSLTGTSALLDPENLGSETGVLNQARFDSSGNTGNIFINTESFNASLGAGVASRTGGSGNAGDVVINAKYINLSALGFIESAALSDRGNAGNVTINTESLTLQNGATVGAATSGDGSAGIVTVNASEFVELMGISIEGSPSFLTANTSGSGNAGNVTINTRKLMVRNGAVVLVGTSGAGAAGNITVNASESVELSGVSTIQDMNGLLLQNSSYLSAITGSSGNAGNIAITTGRLMVRDGGSISASTGDRTGNAGNLTIRALEVEVSGESAPGMVGSNGSNLSVRTSGAGNAGILTIETERLIVRDGGNISASTFDSSGNAGAITIRASDVELIGTTVNNAFSSGLFAFVGQNATGVGGNITVDAKRLIVRDGAEISTSTFGIGNAGSVTVHALDVELIGTSPNGLFLSRLSAEAGFSSTIGNGGSVTIDTERLTVRDRAQINVGSKGVGDAGNLAIIANSISLDNQGQLNAESRSGKDGSLDLQVNNLLLMRRNSLISAINGTPDSAGLDGNITINTQFLVAVPSENSDVVANGFGRTPGSNIQITAQGIFGTQFRESRTSNSDIVATGKVILNIPDVDPSKGLVELPTDVLDATGLIDRRCTANRDPDQRSSFTVTGRGGLPPSPNEPLRGEAVVENWVNVNSREEKHYRTTTNPTITTPKQLVEAQGWMIDSTGQVILTAQAPTATPQSSWQTMPSCQSASVTTQ